MKGQPNYKTTPDQAWSNMKAMLDEAMPVHPRRRYPLWVWWSSSTLGIMLLTGFSYMAMSSSEHSAHGQVPSAVAPVSTFQSSSSVTNTSAPSNVNTKSSSSPENNLNDHQIKPMLNQHQDNQTETKAIKIYPSTPTNTQPKVLIKPITPKQQPSSPPMASSDASAPSQIEIIGMSSPVNDVDASNGLPNEAPSETLIASREIWITDMLSNEAQIDLNLEYSSNPAVGNITPGRVKNKSTFASPYLTANGFSGFDAGLGYMGGVGVDMNISRKFAANISAGYFSYKPDAHLLGYTKQLDFASADNPILYYPTQESQDAYVNEGLVNNASGYNDIQGLVNRLDQLQISAGAKFRMSSRFFTEAGFQLGLFTQAYSNYTFASIDPLSNVIQDVRQNVVLNDYSVVRSTTTSVYAGLGYRLGQHLELFGGITYGLDHYLVNETTTTSADQDDSSRTDYIRGVNLGIRYHL
jgi:hypothetical protein